MSKEEELLTSWRVSTPKFVRDCMRAKEGVIPEPSNQQMQALIEFDKLVIAKTKAYYKDPLTEIEQAYARKIGLSIMSGQGPGKDAFVSWVIWKFLTCFSYCKVICTAPTAHQLRSILWSELAKWMQYSPIRDWFEIQSDKIYFKDTPNPGERWFAIARTANPKDTPDAQAETLAGLHEDYMLIVPDEASGIADPVFKPLEGTLTGKLNLAIMPFNPTKAKGFAIRSQREDRKHWVALHWNCEESTIVQKSHIEFMASKYGRESNTYRMRVLGLPPKMDEFTLLDPEWVDAAVRKENDEPLLLPLDDDEEFMIIDVGAGGDESVVTRRHGPIVIDLQTNSTAESEVLTNWCMGLIHKFEPSIVFIDPLGVGWGIAGNLEQRCPQARIISVNVTEMAGDETRFYRLRDELWWRLREQFEKRIISIPNDMLLIDELLSIRLDRKMWEEKGITKIESKRDMFKRGVESPNRGDTLAMSCYYELEFMRMMKQTASGKNWRKRRAVSWRVA